MVSYPSRLEREARKTKENQKDFKSFLDKN